MRVFFMLQEDRDWALIEYGGQPDVVVVTGAGRGIGRAIAEDMALFAPVLCISQSQGALETAAQIREGGGQAEGMVLDLGDFAAAELRVGTWIRQSGFTRVGGVFAAATLGPLGPMATSDLSRWDETFRVNVLGNLAVARGLLTVQMAHGFGRLLFFAGGGAAYAYPEFPAYAASKAALVRIVENLHEDLKAAGDFATAILAPGAVETDMLAAVRATGAEIRTTVAIEEPTAFAREFLLSQRCDFSGRFVHVRDEWKRYLSGEKQTLDRDLWKLRRVE